MTARPLLYFAFLLCISLSAGGTVVRPQSLSTVDATTGRVILISPKEPGGKLRIKYKKGVYPVDATEGMLVRRGYLLTLDETAKATIICGDGSKHDLRPGPQGCPCTTPCTPEICGIIYDGSTIRSMRGGETVNNSFPIVISPRKTLLLSMRPTIRWASIAGTKEKTTYKVSLYGENRKLIWSREVVSESELPYPDKEAPLKAGETYLVVVSTNGNSSEQEGLPDTGFTLLTAGEARALSEAKAKIKKLKLPKAQTQFLIANLYAARELFAEAIEQLKDLSKTMREPAVIRMLGDLHLAIGLNREAEKRYLEALTIHPEDELEGQALAHMGLAQAYENLGIFDQAAIRLLEAIKAYERLGNSAMVENLKKREGRLRK